MRSADLKSDQRAPAWLPPSKLGILLGSLIRQGWLGTTPLMMTSQSRLKAATMRMYNLIWIIVAACAILFGEAFGQESGGAAFARTLDQFEQHRAQLLSYAAQVELVQFAEEKFNNEVYRSVSLRRFDVVADLTRDSYLIVRNSYSLLPDLGSRADSNLFLKVGPRVFVTGGGVLDEKKSAIETTDFFDPQTVGFGFCAELRRFFEFEDIVGNYRRWQSGFFGVERAGGLITIGAKNADGRYRERYCFAENQGFCPVLIESPRGIGVKVQCNYVNVDGIWLPKVCRYECNPKVGVVVNIDWIAVNKPISRELLDIEKVSIWAGL